MKTRNKPYYCSACKTHYNGIHNDCAVTHPQHTPTPWRAEDQDIMSGDTEVALVSAYNVNRKADAAYIVKCVNAHEALIKAVKLLLDASDIQSLTKQDANFISETLAQAEGK